MACSQSGAGPIGGGPFQLFLAVRGRRSPEPRQGTEHGAGEHPSLNERFELAASADPNCCINCRVDPMAVNRNWNGEPDGMKSGLHLSDCYFISAQLSIRWSFAHS